MSPIQRGRRLCVGEDREWVLQPLTEGIFLYDDSVSEACQGERQMDG